jgi:hypothetical protein
LEEGGEFRGKYCTVHTAEKCKIFEFAGATEKIFVRGKISTDTFHQGNICAAYSSSCFSHRNVTQIGISCIYKT